MVNYDINIHLQDPYSLPGFSFYIEYWWQDLEIQLVMFLIVDE